MKRLPSRIARRKPQEKPREALIRILKLRGEMTVAELCRALKLTHTAVRRQVSALLTDGVISSHVGEHGKGRPAHKYRLSEKAGAYFPTGYDFLAEELLDTIFETGGHKGIMDFLRTNNNRVIAALMPGFSGLGLKERIAGVARYFADRGYMTDWIELADGNYFLFHQNCAIYKMANRYRQLCILEPRLIECLLGVKISRQQYILKGQPTCGYLIDSRRPLVPGED